MSDKIQDRIGLLLPSWVAPTRSSVCRCERYLLSPPSPFSLIFLMAGLVRMST